MSQLGCLLPGRPLNTGFRMVESKKMVLDLEAPGNINEFAVVILQPNIPPGHAIGVYYALPPYQEWQYIGMVSLECASVFFRAPWRGKIPEDTPTLQLGVSLESTAFLQQLQGCDQKEDDRAMDSAKGIAQDLFNFMGSFSQKTAQFANLGNVMVLPTNAVDLWFKKFLHKHNLDPYFWVKKQDTGRAPH